MNTAELPRLRLPPELPAPKAATSFAPERRWRALGSAGAKGRWYSFICYDVILGPEWAWIAQDDWLPEPGGYDPVASEWRQVVELIERAGFWLDLEEPFYDTVTGTWIWAIARVA